MEDSDEADKKLTEIMGKILDDFAAKYEMPVSDVCDQLADEGNRRQEEGEDLLGIFDEEESVGWGTLPEDYDPAKDEDHPMNKKGFDL